MNTFKRKHAKLLIGMAKKLKKAPEIDLDDLIKTFTEPQELIVTEEDKKVFLSNLHEGEIANYNGREEDMKIDIVKQWKKGEDEKKKIYSAILNSIEVFDVIGDDVDKLMAEMTGKAVKEIQNMDFVSEYIPAVVELIDIKGIKEGFTMLDL